MNHEQLWNLYALATWITSKCLKILIGLYVAFCGVEILLDLLHWVTLYIKRSLIFQFYFVSVPMIYSPLQISFAFISINLICTALFWFQNFKKAAEDVTKLSKVPSNEEKLAIYGLFKQGTMGDCNIGWYYLLIHIMWYS